MEWRCEEIRPDGRVAELTTTGGEGFAGCWGSSDKTARSDIWDKQVDCGVSLRPDACMSRAG